MLRCLPAVATGTEIRTEGLRGTDVSDGSGTLLTVYQAKEPGVSLLSRSATACTVEGEDLDMGEMTDFEGKAFGPATPFQRLEAGDGTDTRRYRWTREDHDILAWFSTSTDDRSAVATIARVSHGESE